MSLCYSLILMITSGLGSILECFMRKMLLLKLSGRKKRKEKYFNVLNVCVCLKNLNWRP